MILIGVPEGLELVTDVSAAGWIEEAFPLWPEGLGFSVSDFVPEGFEAYARILHRARRMESDEGSARWAERAAERRKKMHPMVLFEAIVGGRGPGLRLG